MYSSSPLKPKKSYFWESSARLSDPRTSSLKMRKQRKSNSILTQTKLLKRKEKLTPELKSSEFYSIKYLGVTKGEIGVLSKRIRIPQLSPMETCKDVPLAIINNCTDPINKDNSFRKMKSFSKDNISSKRETNQMNDFVVHTYARPRGLSASRQSFKKQNSVLSTLVIQIHRTSVSGWKLQRAKTSSEKRRPRTQVENKDTALQIFSKGQEKNEFGEPYLKFLVKKKND